MNFSLMNGFKNADASLWTGRNSDQQLYLHEKVVLADTNALKIGFSEKVVALLGYACGEGVKRNQGRIGAFDGPDAIRKQLAKMPNHLKEATQLLDIGSVKCLNEDMEDAQNLLSEKVFHLLQKKFFPILIGGGHDIAYGHYNGIKRHFAKDKSLGIINFDAHFDLRNNSTGNNSGTPFYQIAQDCKSDGSDFHYLCLGIRKDGNDTVLFETAKNLSVTYIERQQYSLRNAASVVRIILDFLREVDNVYVTIDLDGFSSAYAPGVSAPSPLGFTPSVVLESLQLILDSKKLVSLDIAEMNPKYDIDNQTAKLAASLVHFVMHNI